MMLLLSCCSALLDPSPAGGRIFRDVLCGCRDSCSMRNDGFVNSASTKFTWFRACSRGRDAVEDASVGQCGEILKDEAERDLDRRAEQLSVQGVCRRKRLSRSTVGTHHGQQLKTKPGVEVRLEPVWNTHEQGDSLGILTVSGRENLKMTVDHPDD